MRSHGAPVVADRVRRVATLVLVPLVVAMPGSGLLPGAGQARSQAIAPAGAGRGRAAPPVPSLARWEQNLKGLAPPGRPPRPGPASYVASFGSAPTLGSLDQDNHYDPIRVFQEGRDYARARRGAGDPSWDPRPFDAAIAAAVRQYRDFYLVPNACGAAGHHAYNTGLTRHYLETGDPLSRDVALLMSTRSAGSHDLSPLQNAYSFEGSREVAFSILMRLNAEDLGQAHRERTDEFVAAALGHIDQWTAPRRSGCLYVRPFMVGLTLEALIAHWDRYRDPRIPPRIKVALDWLRAHAWSPTGGGAPGTGAFLYTDIDVSRLDPVACQGHGYSPDSDSGPAPDLGLLIAPAYAWYYLYSGDPTYRTWGDQAWAGSAGATTVGTQKVYNQSYRWSRRFLEWRRRGAAEWPAAKALNLAAPAPAVGQANAFSPSFRVAFDDAPRSFPRPVVVTFSDAGRGGTFLPRMVRLTPDHPEASFRYRPPAIATGPVTISAANDGGLAAPPPVTYAVRGVAPTATGYEISGPKSGLVGRPSAFSVALTPAGSVPPPSVDGEGGLLLIELSDAARLGDLTPRTGAASGRVWLSAERPVMEFVYKPTGPGRGAIRARNEGGLADPPDVVEDVVVPRPDASYRPKVGDRARLFDVEGPGVVPVLGDPAAYRDYLSAMRRPDGQGRLQEMRRAGSFLVLPDGGMIDVIRILPPDGRGTAIEVRFRDGPLDGKSAWVPARFVTNFIDPRPG